MKIVRAQFDGTGEFLQRHRLASRLDELTGLGNEDRVFRVEGRTFRLASFAGSETRGTCRRQAAVKSNILRICGPRGARRAAKDTGGLDRVPKGAIGAFVAHLDSRPTRALLRRRQGSNAFVDHHSTLN